MNRTTRRSHGHGSGDAPTFAVRAHPSMRVLPFSVQLEFELFMKLEFQLIVGSMSSLDEVMRDLQGYQERPQTPQSLDG